MTAGRICRDCQKTKPITEFYLCGKKYYYICKLCTRKKNREYKEKNKLALQRKARIYRYGVGHEEYETLEKKHDGLCHICRSKKGICVDHCHKTKNVRGLLCSQCNTALGAFYDNIATIERAISYLKEATK